MKHILSSVFLLLLILALSFWNASAVTRMTDRWRDQITQATTLAKENRWEEAAEAIKKSHRDWSSRQQYLHVILKHDVIEEAQMMYHRTIAFAQTKALEGVNIKDLAPTVATLLGVAPDAEWEGKSLI